MPSYNCWTKHGEKGVMMEDNEEEEDDDDPIFPDEEEEYGDTAMEDNEEGDEEQGHQMSPLMILVGSLLMQRKECDTVKRRS